MIRHVTVLGLGEAGSELARDLLRAGVRGRGHDPNPARTVDGPVGLASRAWWPGAWAWLIDAVGAFLALLSVTGLGLLWYLRKVRARALLAVAVGGALAVALAALAA